MKRLLILLVLLVPARAFAGPSDIVTLLEAAGH